MARCFPSALLILASLAWSSSAPAEQAPTAPGNASAGAPLRLGPSAIVLNGPWMFKVGDSPIDPTSHERLWAEPGFDDSQWETVDLTPVPDQPDSLTRDPHGVKGWTARGHAGYGGWAWYRLRVRVATVPGEQMAIDGPMADDAWQLFAEGKLQGSFGKFDNRGDVRRIYGYRPLMIPLPPVERTEGGVVTETLAFRVWMNNGSLTDANVGGLRSAPLLVAAAAMTAQSRIDWQAMLLGKLDQAVYVAMFLLFAVLAASLVLFDRSDRVYLWVAATMLISTAGYVALNICALTEWLDSRIADQFMSIDLQTSGWVMVWWVWFQLRRPAWAPKAVAGLTVAYAAAISLKTALIDFDIASPQGPHAALLDALGFIVLVFMVALLVALALIVSAGIRKEGREGWWALLVVVTIAVEMFAPAFGLIHIGSFHGVVLRIWDVTDPTLVGVLVFLMLRRLLRSLDRQRQMALDVKQAQEVQQVILPEARLVFPGLVIESEYRPAREVGGDFFQIIPHKTDGSLLIVAGDVTGKGLKAGMLVALLVGGTRSTVDWSTDPVVVLHALNRRLIGRGDAQATCLALRIAKDGAVTLANAGHMAPYLNGEPVAMEGALPLGMIEGAEFSVMHFQLKDGDKLVLMSDGIAEATDAEGHLFGFERVQELVRSAKNAADLAAEAQRFGQEDDISVISVTRTAMSESAAA